jgi:hypothetical protein
MEDMTADTPQQRALDNVQRAAVDEGEETVVGPAVA